VFVSVLVEEPCDLEVERHERYLWCSRANGANLELYHKCVDRSPVTLGIPNTIQAVVALVSELPLRIRNFPAQDIPGGLCAGDLRKGG